MADNNNINIGGVRFNKNDVAKSEIIKKDGKELNSVFLRDGTKVVYPNQAEKNESVISMKDEVKHSKSPFGYSMSSGGFGIDNGTDPTMINVGGKDKKTGNVDIEFRRISNAEITGTNKKDDYTLTGCRNTKVDISQNDGAVDSVTIQDDDRNEHYRGFFGNREPVKGEDQHSVDSKVFKSGHNVVKQDKDDITYTQTGKKGLAVKFECHRDKGTIKE